MKPARSRHGSRLKSTRAGQVVKEKEEGCGMKWQTSLYRRWRVQLVLGCILGLLLSQVGPQSSAAAVPFQPGEKATYQVRWSFLVGGQVELAVEKDGRGADTEARHFSLTARSYPIVDIFYKVRERIDSVIHPSNDTSIAMRFEMWSVGLQMISSGVDGRDTRPV